MTDETPEFYRSPLDVKGFPPKVSAQRIHDTIIKAIRNAGEKALAWVPLDVSATPEMVILRREIAEAELQMEQLSRTADQLYESINRRHDNGEYINTGEAAKRLNAELDERVKERDQAVARLQRCRADLEVAVMKARADSQTVAAEALFELLEHLSDPYDRTYQRVIRQSLHNPAFATKTIGNLSRQVWDVHFTAELRAGHGPGAVVIPIDARWTQGDALTVAEHRLALLDELAAGVPADPERVRWRKSATADLAQILDIDRRTASWLLYCSDPRILRTAMACLQRAGRTNEEVAEQLGEPVEFVETVDRTWSVPKAWWFASRRPRQLAACYVDAVQHDGEITDRNLRKWLSLNGMYRLYPERRIIRTGRAAFSVRCCRCGSFAAALLKFREAHGAICLDCRKDYVGVEWPEIPYDHYITGRDLYEAHGLVNPLSAELPEVQRPDNGLYNDGDGTAIGSLPPRPTSVTAG